MASYRLNREFLADAAEALGWGDADDLIRALVPTQDKVRKGVLGEILACEALTTFCGYEIPIRKLRFALTRNQSMPSTDVLGLRVVQGRVEEAAFVEAKLRTVMDLHVAAGAHEQLARDYSKRVPDMLVFVGQRLREEGHELYGAFMEYLASRRSAPLDAFHVFIVCDTDVWSEDALRRLDEVVPLLAPLTVSEVRVVQLQRLVEEVFEGAGLEVAIADE